MVYSVLDTNPRNAWNNNIGALGMKEYDMPNNGTNDRKTVFDILVGNSIWLFSTL